MPFSFEDQPDSSVVTVEATIVSGNEIDYLNSLLGQTQGQSNQGNQPKAQNFQPQLDEFIDPEELEPLVDKRPAKPESRKSTGTGRRFSRKETSLPATPVAPAVKSSWFSSFSIPQELIERWRMFSTATTVTFGIFGIARILRIGFLFNPQFIFSFLILMMVFGCLHKSTAVMLRIGVSGLIAYGFVYLCLFFVI